MTSFIMIKNDMVWNEERHTIVQDKKELAYIYLFLNIMRNGTGNSKFTLNEIIESCGKVPKSGKGKTIEQFKNILCDLVDSGNIIGIDKDIINNAKPNTVLNFKFDDKLDTEKDKFFKVSTLKLTKLLELKADVIAFNIFCYICARCIGKEYCFPKKEDFLKDLNIDKATLDKYLNFLKDNQIIYVDYAGKDGVKNTNNVYALNMTALQEGLNNSREFHKKQGKEIHYKPKEINPVEHEELSTIRIHDKDKMNIVTVSELINKLSSNPLPLTKKQNEKVNNFINMYNAEVVYETIYHYSRQNYDYLYSSKINDADHRRNTIFRYLSEENLDGMKKVLLEEKRQAERDRIREKNISDRERENRIIESESLKNEEDNYDYSDQLEGIRKEANALDFQGCENLVNEYNNNNDDDDLATTPDDMFNIQISI